MNKYLTHIEIEVHDFQMNHNLPYEYLIWHYSFNFINKPMCMV